jgi:GT2 family glycosyltransferase
MPLYGQSNITYGRNVLTAAFLGASNKPWAVWIDDDVAFTPGMINELVTVAEREHLDIVGAAYPTKMWGNCRPIISAYEDGEVTFGEGGGLVRAKWLGGGMLVVSRAAHEKIAAVRAKETDWMHYWTPWGVFRGAMAWRQMGVMHEGCMQEMGEDVGFCESADEAGYSIWCDTRIRLWHYGPHGYDIADNFTEPTRPDSITIHCAGWKDKNDRLARTPEPPSRIAEGT